MQAAEICGIDEQRCDEQREQAHKRLPSAAAISASPAEVAADAGIAAAEITAEAAAAPIAATAGTGLTGIALPAARVGSIAGVGAAASQTANASAAAEQLITEPR